MSDIVERLDELLGKTLDAFEHGDAQVIEQAKDALEQSAARIAELGERVHYAEGAAELAMKHRDEAEAALTTATRDALERAAAIAAEECYATTGRQIAERIRNLDSERSAET